MGNGTGALLGFLDDFDSVRSTIPDQVLRGF